METLVLNIEYMPLRHVPVAEAITELLKGRAEVVDAYDEAVPVGASGIMSAPSVIRFITKASARVSRHGVKFCRANIYIRDKGRCCYCDRPVTREEFTFDHVFPYARGGQRRWDNIVCACPDCNGRKRCRTPEEAGMRLLRKPYRPTSLPGVAPEIMTWRDDFPLRWKDWIASVGYWTAQLDP